MYIYQADVWCDSCAEKICAELRADGKPDTDDSEDYPQGPYDENSSEADTPQHCAGCLVFLENPLTEDGVRYVIDQVLESPGKVSETVQEWLEFYNLGYESEPYFDRFDICEAYYLFASLYHSGQFSKEYRIFGRLNRMGFNLGHSGLSYERLSENARGIFIRLAAKEVNR